MTRVKIKEISYNGTNLTATITAIESCNINGNINISLHESYWKKWTNRPLNEATFKGNRGKVIGKIFDYDINRIFGQEKSKDRKKRLKREFVYKRKGGIMGSKQDEKDNKWEIQFIESNQQDNKMKYTELWEAIEQIDSVDRVEELDMGSKKVILWRTEVKADMLEIAKAMEEIKAIGEIKLIKKLDVK